MDWKPFVCRVSCSKIKQKTCFLNRGAPIYWSLGSNIMEPGLQYIGAHQTFVIQNRLVCLKYFFAITQMRFNKTQSIWIGFIQLKKGFSMSHKIMFRSVVVKGFQYNEYFRHTSLFCKTNTWWAPIYWSPGTIILEPGHHYIGAPLVQKTSFLFYFLTKGLPGSKKDPSPNQFFCHCFGVPFPKMLIFKTSSGIFLRKNVF